MWLLFHHSKGTQRVADGRVLDENCPTCNKVTRLDEVETSEDIGVWFVDIVGDKQRGFRCRVCGDVFSLRDNVQAEATRELAAGQQHERAAALEAQQQRDRIAALAEQRRLEAAREVERNTKATRIEDELAELKKRMGR